MLQETFEECARSKKPSDAVNWGVMASYSDLLAGNLRQALDLAHRAHSVARDSYARAITSLAVGRAFHQLGRLSEAKFWMSTSLGHREKLHPLRRYVQNYWYCEFALEYDPKSVDKIARRTQLALDSAIELAVGGNTRARTQFSANPIQTEYGGLPRALNMLTLAQCEVLRNCLKSNLSGVRSALSRVKEASDAIRLARATHERPRGWLAEIEALRALDSDEEARQLAEDGLRFAEYYGMGLFQLEFQIQLAMIAKKLQDGVRLTDRLREVRSGVDRLGFGRRRHELNSLGVRLARAPRRVRRSSFR